MVQWGRNRVWTAIPTTPCPLPEVWARSSHVSNMSIHCGPDSVCSRSFPRMEAVARCLRALPFPSDSTLEPAFLRWCPWGSIRNSATGGFPAIPLKLIEKKMTSERANPQLLAQGKVLSVWSLLTFPSPCISGAKRIHCPCLPLCLLWIGIFYWAFLSCAAHCSLFHRSAKLVPRGLFLMKLKISISLCLLLETWSLPWQKGQ